MRFPQGGSCPFAPLVSAPHSIKLAYDFDDPYQLCIALHRYIIITINDAAFVAGQEAVPTNSRNPTGIQTFFHALRVRILYLCMQQRLSQCMCCNKAKAIANT